MTMGKVCERCDRPAKHGNLCAACLADDMDYEEEDCDPEGPAFDCAGYYPGPAGEFYCPLWGSEECDWECPHGGRKPDE